MDSRQEEARHRERMIKRKAVQDAEVASKTIAEKSLLIVHTGPGKGKSTAAFGLALRALGQGWKVGVVQFIKGARETGERRAFAAFGDRVAWRTMGEGFTWRLGPRPGRRGGAGRLGGRAGDDGRSGHSHARARRTQRRLALRLPCARRGCGEPASAPADLHVVVTGRNAKPEMIAAADLVTEMGAVKHQFAAGVRAQAGIEF